MAPIRLSELQLNPDFLNLQDGFEKSEVWEIAGGII